ncbi:unnamed protein product [Rhodiola kirilowii]
MGRPPSNGVPTFRFNAAEVMEMETILQDHNNMMPAREVLVAISDKFSNSPERQGKFVVQTKQIWNWFQNKRYANRAKSSKAPTKLTASSMQSMPTVPAPHPVPSTMSAMQEMPFVPVVPSTSTIPVVSRVDNLSSSGLPQSLAASTGKLSTDNIPMEFEARSARDGAWYDATAFLSLKNLEAGDPEVLVRFAGFGPEDDEWINVRKHIRHRSLPCEPSECVAVLPGDLILCFQEGKEQALYFDAHVLDAQRRRHDVRGCRCRFLVRYDHDQSEEIVPLRKICRRPETDYRLQQLHAMNESSAEHRKSASSSQHKALSVEQITTNVDQSFSKAGISDSTGLSVQNPPAPNLHVNPLSVSEELKSAMDCSTDKTIGATNATPSSTQQSHPEVINLDLETEAEKNSHEVKDATDDMAEEPLEKPCLVVEKTDVMPMCEIDAAAKTGLAVEKTDVLPICRIDATSAQNAAEVVRDEASLIAGTDPVVEGGQVDTEQMIVETDSTTDDGKINIDLSKSEGTNNSGRYMNAEAEIPKINLPAEPGNNIAEGSGPAMASSIGTDVTLGQEVTETSGTTDAGKLNEQGNVTIPSTREDTDQPGEEDCGPTSM